MFKDELYEARMEKKDAKRKESTMDNHMIIENDIENKIES